jgi:hypothetical protein
MTSCYKGYELSNGICYEKCSSGETKINNRCVGSCRPNDIIKSNSTCLDKSSYFEVPPGKQCNYNEERNGAGCMKIYNRPSRIPIMTAPCIPGKTCYY